jgi:hypothetical protein
MLPRLALRLAVLVATLALSGSMGAQSFDLAAHPRQRNVVHARVSTSHRLGLVWFKVTLPSSSGPLALWVPLIATNFQINADDRLIGENGVMPPHPIGRTVEKGGPGAAPRSESPGCLPVHEPDCA